MAFQDCAAVVEGLFPRLKMVPLDEDPFSAGEPVRFEDDAGEFSEEGLDTGNRCEIPEFWISRDTVLVQQVPCEGLRCLQAGQIPDSAQRRDSRRQESIHKAVAQGVPGADNGEVGAAFSGKSYRR